MKVSPPARPGRIDAICAASMPAIAFSPPFGGEAQQWALAAAESAPQQIPPAKARPGSESASRTSQTTPALAQLLRIARRNKSSGPDSS
jgi:hypothetical protein